MDKVFDARRLSGLPYTSRSTCYDKHGTSVEIFWNAGTAYWHIHHRSSKEPRCRLCFHCSFNTLFNSGETQVVNHFITCTSQEVAENCARAWRHSQIAYMVSINAFGRLPERSVCGAKCFKSLAAWLKFSVAIGFSQLLLQHKLRPVLCRALSLKLGNWLVPSNTSFAFGNSIMAGLVACIDPWLFPEPCRLWQLPAYRPSSTFQVPCLVWRWRQSGFR